MNGLSAYFDDLAFEDLERFLNQRVILEILLFEWNRFGCRFVLRRGRFVTRTFRWRRNGRGGRFGDGLWNAITVCWRVGLQKFHMRIGKTGLVQFGLNQRSV